MCEGLEGVETVEEMRRLNGPTYTTLHNYINCTQLLDRVHMRVITYNIFYYMTSAIVQVVSPPPQLPNASRAFCPSTRCPQWTLYPWSDCPLLVQNDPPMVLNTGRQVNSQSQEHLY